MIIVRLVGGLGNQMFQYALGRRLSIKNKQELKIDTSGYAGNLADPKKGIRVFSLANFNIAASIATERDLKRFNKYKGTNLVPRIIRKINRLRNYLNCEYMVEPQAVYSIFQPALLELKTEKDLYIDGYWATEKYFSAIEDVIRQDFTFKNRPEEINQKIIDDMKAGESVAIHIRHGDNANSHAKAHGVLPMEYYHEAVKKLILDLKDPKFYVFSDDPEWAKENLVLDYPTQYISHNGDDKNYEDLRLMSNCQHHIIGNSTFSWWGAWLGKNSKQIVFAPRVYHIGHDVSNTDYFPKNWNLI